MNTNYIKNIVIVGISDTADRIISFIDRYKLFNVLGCAVNKPYLPKGDHVFIGGGKKKSMGFRRVV